MASGGIPCFDMAERSPSEQLAEAVRRRRIWLGYEPMKRWQGKRLSEHTIRKIESGRYSNYERATLIKLDYDLEWEPGSAEAVLAGGSPTERPNADRSAS